MARLLPGVYSAINDLSQMPEGAQSLNAGYVVKANRGPVGEFNLATNPTDFLTKYTFSGQPSLTDDPTMHEIIKVLAQTNTMYISRAANNPLYGGAIVKKAQNHGFIIGVDQVAETFLLIVDPEDRAQKVPTVAESIILSGTGLFDGKYTVDKINKIDGYTYEFTDAEENVHTCNVYEVKLRGEDPIYFSNDVGYAIKSCGKNSLGSPANCFEIAGNMIGLLESFEGEDIILTISGSSEAGSSGIEGVDNNGYYLVKSFELHEEADEYGDPVYSTYIFIDTTDREVFKTSVGEITKDDKGQLLVNNKFSGTSAYTTPVIPLSEFKIGDIYKIDATKNEETKVVTKKIYLNGDLANKFATGDKILVKGSPIEGTNSNDGEYTVVKAEEEDHKTIITVKEKFKFTLTLKELKSIETAPESPARGDFYYDSTQKKVFEYIDSEWVEPTQPEGELYIYVFEDVDYYVDAEGKLTPYESLGYVSLGSIVSPEASYEELLGKDDLFLITGIDPGAYNGLEAFSIVSAFDNPDELVYVKGAEGLFPEPCPFDTMELTVYNAETNAPLESFTFSRDKNAKTIDGISLFINDVVKGSAYIKVFNNPNNTDMPNSTLAGSPIQASGGSDGDPVTPTDLVKALGVFEDKTIPVSIMCNGCSPEAESEVFQQALLALANTRKDMFVFLNSPASKEKATIASTRAQDIVNYKKNNLASTSFYGCMYAPHVTSPDVFNSRNVKIGAASVATAGWLNVINSLNYPYAYAGPRNGLVTGVTCDWKIGDMSGEAEMLNDASINYVAYDGRVGRYYMQCQNTLQVANSAMRSIGVILNVLDIKETLVTYLKEFLNLPITDSLRRDIMDTVGDYLSPMVGNRFYNYVFQDTTTDADLAQDTLRYLLTLSPSRYAQRIYLVMNIVRTGFDFSILQSV